MAAPQPKQPANTPEQPAKKPAIGANKVKPQKKKAATKKAELSWPDLCKAITDAATATIEAADKVSYNRDETGEEIKPAADTLGIARAASLKLRSAFKTQMKDYTSMTPENTIADEIDNDIMGLRILLQKASETATGIADKVKLATDTLDEQRQLWAGKDTAELKIQEEEAKIKARQEAVEALRTALNKARGSKKGNG